MKTKKRSMKPFLFYDYEQVARHLEKMARKGWMLTKITKLYWEYRWIEPTELHFTVSYFPEASQLNLYPGEKQEEFWAYCEAAGWKLAAQWEQMQIMYSEESEPVPVETDEPVKLEMIHRAMKKAWIPGSIALLLVNLFQLSRLWPGEINWFYTDTYWVGALAIIFFTLYLGTMLAGYGIWYLRSSRAVEAGGKCVEPRRCRWLTTGLLWLTILLLVAEYVLLFRESLWITLLFCGTFILLVVGVYGLTRAFKLFGLPKTANLICTTLIGAGVIALVMNGLAHWLSSNEDRLTGGEREIVAEDLRLSVEALKEPDYSYVEPIFELEQSSSVFMNWELGREYAVSRDDTFDKVEYRIYEIKTKWIYDKFLELITGETDLSGSRWQQIDSGGWEADAVYQYQFEVSSAGRLYDEVYVICENNQIVWLAIDWETTEDELTLAFELLGISNAHRK